jgi:23S rRNA (cytidine1920-2'-O)/16S rRNA (cytidine1409-2'-O)-methyltransferase
MADRADVELVRRGLARSRRHASTLVVEGRVRADGTVVTKASAPVAVDAELVVEPDPLDQGFASRAGGKLAGVLDALDGDVDGRTVTARIDGARCLDLGASTGGFTDVLLRRGAAQVTALDVGHDQILPRLRDDERVVVVEGFNVRDLTPGDLDGPPDVVVGDLSFISLRLVVAAVAGATSPGAAVLLLVKPQFEVGRDRLGSGGVVRDPELRAAAVVDVVTAAAGVGLHPRAVIPSPVPGPSGNHEYFCWFERTADAVAADVDSLTRAAGTAVAWTPDGTPPVVAVEGRRQGGST